MRFVITILPSHGILKFSSGHETTKFLENEHGGRNLLKVVLYLYIKSHKVAYALTCKNEKDCIFYEKWMYETSKNSA